MESAKKALGLTKYFISLPSTPHLIAYLLLGTLLAGAGMGWAQYGRADSWSLLSGAGSAIIVVGMPTLLCAILLAILRRRVTGQRALAVAAVSALIYLAADLAAVLLHPYSPLSINLVFVGFGLAALWWLVVLQFAFGLKRFAWIFAFSQMVAYALFHLAAPGLLTGATSDILVKTTLAGAVFISALYGVLFIVSGPMKKNLGVSSPDALSMFASQWLYGEKDLEDAFDEMGENVRTLMGVATFSTRNGKLHWVVPYIHFGPFGNLGGSQFSYQISEALAARGSDHFVFHGTATHDLDPVSSAQLSNVLMACQQAISSCKPKPARFSFTTGSAGDSRCHLLSVNDLALCSFTRAPLSTEDVNFAIGCQLMERACRPLAAGRGLPARDALVIDCHNAETGDVDYIEAGSPIVFEMSDALDEAMEKTKKAKSSALFAGWASVFPTELSGLGSNGIRVTCLAGADQKSNFIILLDSNGITAEAREGLISAVKKSLHASFAEVYTTDTHQLNTIRGVFNPAGALDYEKLEKAVLECAKAAQSHLSPAAFDMKKVRMNLKVLGPYQSAEIVSTLNAAWSILRILLPIGLLVAIGLVMWLLGKV